MAITAAFGRSSNTQSASGSNPEQTHRWRMRSGDASRQRFGQNSGQHRRQAGQPGANRQNLVAARSSRSASASPANTASEGRSGSRYSGSLFNESEKNTRPKPTTNIRSTPASRTFRRKISATRGVHGKYARQQDRQIEPERLAVLQRTADKALHLVLPDKSLQEWLSILQKHRIYHGAPTARNGPQTMGRRRSAPVLTPGPEDWQDQHQRHASLGEDGESQAGGGIRQMAASPFCVQGRASRTARENVAASGISTTAGVAEADPSGRGSEDRRGEPGWTFAELPAQQAERTAPGRPPRRSPRAGAAPRRHPGRDGSRCPSSNKAARAFRTTGSPHSRGVTQSPERAISRPIAA